MRHFGQLFSISSSVHITHSGDYIIPKKGAIQMWEFLFCCSESINLAQAFDDIMQSFCHSYVCCSIHLAIDIWIIWDIKTSTTVWSVAKLWRYIWEWSGKRLGHWNFPAKDPCLCLEGYCILLPAPPTIRAHVGLGPSSMKEWIKWMNGCMDTECIHFIAGVWPCF